MEFAEGILLEFWGSYAKGPVFFIASHVTSLGLTKCQSIRRQWIVHMHFPCHLDISVFQSRQLGQAFQLTKSNSSTQTFSLSLSLVEDTNYEQSQGEQPVVSCKTKLCRVGTRIFLELFGQIKQGGASRVQWLSTEISKEQFDGNLSICIPLLPGDL